MKVSYLWLSELVDLGKLPGEPGPASLARLLTARGLEVEAIERQDQGFARVVTAKIIERAKHPGSDRLSLCRVTVGAGPELQIVCGAQNMKSGDVVALAQIGAELPNGLKIAEGKIRGESSFGMLCSEEELKLKDSSEGILILPPGTPLGVPLAQFLGRDDTFLTLKLTANRGDCMSHFGLAREIASALGVKPKRPAGPALKYEGADSKSGAVSLKLEAGEDAPQFYAVLLEGVKVGPSPDWLVRRLEAVGSRSINNVVDATNLVMLEQGHPVHAYDADRLQKGGLGVRAARAGEKLALLDGTAIELAGTELVVADGPALSRPVGLAGVMGGSETEVTSVTKRVLLECAEFAPTLVRKASAKHARRTEAAQRFEKGIDPAALPRVIERLAELVRELAGGSACKVVASSAQRQPSRQAGYAAPEIRVAPDFFGRFLGLPVTPETAERVLAGLECEIKKAGTAWTVRGPTYRRDLKIPEDLAEEIARTLGYDQIPSTLPPLTSSPTFGASAREPLAWINRAKDALASLGLSEDLTYSFTSRAWLARFGMAPGALVVNPLSEEHEAMVPSLLPGLVRNALENWNAQFGATGNAIRLFEIRPVFSGAAEARGEMEVGTVERLKIAFAVSGPRYAQALKAEQGEVDFYDIKALVEQLFEQLGTKGIRFQVPRAGAGGAVGGLFHPGQSVEILAGKDSAGFFGLLHPGKARELKARAPLWIGEIDADAVRKLSRAATGPAAARAFKGWPEWPSIERDFALIVREDVTTDKITQVALKAGRPLAKVAKVFDIYRGSQVAQGMTSIAVRVIFNEDQRSLQEAEAETASKLILEAWRKELGAELRS